MGQTRIRRPALQAYRLFILSDSPSLISACNHATIPQSDSLLDCDRVFQVSDSPYARAYVVLNHAGVHGEESGKVEQGHESVFLEHYVSYALQNLVSPVQVRHGQQFLIEGVYGVIFEELAAEVDRFPSAVKVYLDVAGLFPTTRVVHPGHTAP